MELITDDKIRNLRRKYSFGLGRLCERTEKNRRKQTQKTEKDEDRKSTSEKKDPITYSLYIQLYSEKNNTL